MAHHVEARKDGADGVFLPPARTIGFNPKLTFNDSLLAQSYVECYDISYPEALRRIEDEVRELRQHIENDGSYELHGVGVVTLDDNGHLVFEPCEAGILTPSLYGLSGFGMPLLQELQEAGKRQTASEPAAENGTTADMDTETPDEHADRASGSRLVALWRTVAAACVTVLVFMLFPTPLANNDHLQTASAINVDLLQQVSTAALPAQAEVSTVQTASPAATPAETTAHDSDADSEPRSGYVIVLASRVSRTGAQVYVDALHKRGYAEARVASSPRNTKVIYGFYDTQAAANSALADLRKADEFGEAWIMKHQQ